MVNINFSSVKNHAAAKPDRKSSSRKTLRKRKDPVDLAIERTRSYEESVAANKNLKEPNPDELLRRLHNEGGRISHEMGTLLQNSLQYQKSMEYYRNSLQLTITSEIDTAHFNVDMLAVSKMKMVCRQLDSEYKEMYARLSSNGCDVKSKRDTLVTFPFKGEVCMSFFHEPLSSQDYEKEHFTIIGNACTLYNMAILNYADEHRENAAKLLNMSLLTIDENCKDLSSESLVRMRYDILSLQAMILCNLGYIYYEGEFYEESLVYFQASLAHFADLAETIRVRKKKFTQNQKKGRPFQKSDASSNSYGRRESIKCDTNIVKVLLNKTFCVMKMDRSEEVSSIISTARCILNNLHSKLESDKELFLMTRAVEAIVAIECHFSFQTSSSSTTNLSQLLEDVKDLASETMRYLGTMHPLFHTLQGLLGDVFRALGKLQESKKAYLNCMSLCRRLHGESHPLTASSLINLGLSMYYQDELVDSLNLLQAGFKIQRKEKDKTGEMRLNGLKTMLNIGQVWYARGFLQEAVEIYEQLFQEARMKLGPANVFVQDLLQTLALVLDEMGRTDESMRYFIQSANTTASIDRMHTTQNMELNLGSLQISSILQNQRSGVFNLLLTCSNGSDHHAAAA